MLEGKNYVPTLAIRASEMNGLEYLPGANKDRMTPCFLLAPWANSVSIERSVVRIERAFPNRGYFLDIDRDYICSNPESSAQRELQSLIDPSENFKNWIDFAGRHTNLMPCIQHIGQTRQQIIAQIELVQNLGRAYCLRLERVRMPDNIEEVVGAFSYFGNSDFAIILEGGWTDDPLSMAAWFNGIISVSLSAIDATVPIVLSCTSMPKIFTPFNSRNPTRIPFSNRQLVEQVGRSTNRASIIYGDWGSTRPRQPSGISNRPLDRVDYPTSNAWYIARNKEDNWDFRDAASAILNIPEWDGGLGIWGEEMIRKTTINSALGIDTPQKNIASRVNIHLFRQTSYGLPRIDPISLDEDWVD